MKFCISSMMVMHAARTETHFPFPVHVIAIVRMSGRHS